MRLQSAGGAALLGIVKDRDLLIEEFRDGSAQVWGDGRCCCANFLEGNSGLGERCRFSMAGL